LRFTFDRWTLDTHRRVLLRGSEAVSLSPKAFELLKFLVEHDERAFSKAELHEHLWPNTFVSDGSLTILIAELRQVLQDDASQPRFIRTVRRFGYGFCAPVAKTDSPQVSSTVRNAWVIWGHRSIAVAEGDTILGRALDATIRFDLPGVSRRHARISVESGSVSVEDLGSQNGTYLRGERLTGRAALADGDELRLGPVSVLIRLVSPDSSTLPM
jgi:DNA-binding winged helix-turn-helix (wHTH) protein